MQSCHSSAAIGALKGLLGQLRFTKLRCSGTSCCGVFVAKQRYSVQRTSSGDLRKLDVLENLGLFDCLFAYQVKEFK